MDAYLSVRMALGCPPASSQDWVRSVCIVRKLKPTHQMFLHMRVAASCMGGCPGQMGGNMGQLDASLAGMGVSPGMHVWATSILAPACMVRRMVATPAWEASDGRIQRLCIWSSCCLP
jgi:hypothetical protein